MGVSIGLYDVIDDACAVVESALGRCRNRPATTDYSVMLRVPRCWIRVSWRLVHAQSAKSRINSLCAHRELCTPSVCSPVQWTGILELQQEKELSNWCLLETHSSAYVSGAEGAVRWGP